MTSIEHSIENNNRYGVNTVRFVQNFGLSFFANKGQVDEADAMQLRGAWRLGLGIKNVYLIGHSPLGLFRTNINKQ